MNLRLHPLKLDPSRDSGAAPYRKPCSRRTRRRSWCPNLDCLEDRTLLSATLIKDVNSVDAYPSNLMAAGTNLFYNVADIDGVHDDFMVTTSGGATTKLSSDVSFPGWAAAVGNSVLFTTYDPAGNTQGLWTSDGTVAGTKTVAFSDPAQTQSTEVENLVSTGDTFYFLSTVPYYGMDGNTYGPDLWKLGPQDAAPVLVAANLSSPNNRGTFPSTATELMPVGETVYFLLDGSLWSSDGTTSGTKAYTYSDTLGSTQYVTNVESLFSDNGVLSYESTTPTQQGYVYTLNLLSSSGAPLTVYTSDNSDSRIIESVAVGPILYFTVADSLAGDTRLMKSDGTADNASLVYEFPSGSGSSSPWNLINVGGTLFFTTTGPQGRDQIWKSDGTRQGTVMVRDLAVNLWIGSGYLTSQVPALATLGGILYFTDSDATHGAELWKTDGSSGGTQLVKDIDPGTAGSAAHDFAVVGSSLFFVAHDGSTPLVNQLWKTNGAGSGTVLVQSFALGKTQDVNADGSYFSGLYAANPSDPYLVFTGEDGLSGSSIWRTDGTGAGTISISSLEPWTYLSFQGSVFFTAFSSQVGFALYKTDGTASGTVVVKNLTVPAAGNSAWVGDLVSADGRFFFSFNPGVEELWVSDGTEAGTVKVSSLSSVNVYLASALGSSILFRASDDASGDEPWISDGTASGTHMLADIAAGSQSSDPLDFTPFGTRALFFASSASNTLGLYETDGTASGTRLVTSSSKYLSNLTVVGTTAYFTLDNQLWETDGTSSGTVQNLAFRGVVPVVFPL